MHSFLSRADFPSKQVTTQLFGKCSAREPRRARRSCRTTLSCTVGEMAASRRIIGVALLWWLQQQARHPSWRQEKSACRVLPTQRGAAHSSSSGQMTRVGLQPGSRGAHVAIRRCGDTLLDGSPPATHVQGRDDYGRTHCQQQESLIPLSHRRQLQRRLARRRRGAAAAAQLEGWAVDGRGAWVDKSPGFSPYELRLQKKVLGEGGGVATGRTAAAIGWRPRRSIIWQPVVAAAADRWCCRRCIS